MTYTELDHKKMWVEKLDKDLEQLHALGYDNNSNVYKNGLRRTKKAQRELKTMENKEVTN
ncbi:TPA: hypothetical protein ACWWCX_003020 [Enterococcus faecium]|uniref:hypothetical protein n=1 Tax=Enterococcus TaxID=1350 RepID=UPI000D381739|nr:MULTISPECIES: hypothetical protein [Enterococcus]EHM3054778.1 hypothetical protein [Enterococcus faecium]EMF0185084.1 hypothetical protein [Enterococcus hirae]MDP8584629.1 hypothetical protein [Listeria innocua]MBK1999418.1 hypothetical protein [Enterococcus lactis]MDQ8554250.1 hypothetical protein [Enterococcus faecium]